MITTEDESKILFLNAKLTSFLDENPAVNNIIRSPESITSREVRVKLLAQAKESFDQYTLKNKEAEKHFRPTGQFTGWTKSVEGDRIKQEGQKFWAAGREFKMKALQFPWPLTFEEAGRSIKLLLPILGKFNWYGTTSDEFKTKVIGWKSASEENLTKASCVLIENGIRSFDINSNLRFILNVPSDCYPTSFYKSDDPEEWQLKNELKVAKIEAQKKIREVTKKLDRKE